MIATMWLGAVLVGLLAWTVHDKRQYAYFKTADDSAVRRAFYRRWTWQSFVYLAGGSAVTLLILGRSDAVIGIPAEFRELAAAFSPPAQSRPESGEAMLGMAIGFTVGLAIAIGFQVWRIRKMLTPVAGDVEALIPRNRAEMWTALPLSLNAGFSEELFFRLALPLLIAHVTGSAMIGIVAAIALFGSIHTYQGWKGVAATTFVGAILTLVYFQSGSLLRPMILHAAIDIVGLIVRPWIASRLQMRSKEKGSANRPRLLVGSAVNGAAGSN